MAPQRVRIRMLGGFDVHIDGVAVPAGAWRLSKARSLLKLLALAEGHSMHRDAVVDALWPELGASTNNLHQALHAARRALAVAGTAADVLRLRDGVVALCPDGGLETDLQVLEAAFDKALAAADPDLLLDIAARCAEGLLPEDRYEDWVSPYQDHIADLRRAAVLAAAPHLIAQGRAYDAAAALEPLAETRPVDEDVHRTLMLAFDAAGRRWDAVAVYESLRSRLDDEYAAAPDVQTTTLYRQLLTGQADALAGGLHHLAWPGTRFVGRRREIEELVAVCTRNRLVTLSGPGGAGKTRLAVEVARVLAKTSSYADGLWMVDLSGVRDPELVPATAASALELTLSGSRPTVAALTPQLAARELVVVLDNCEHVIDAAATLVRAIIQDCPGITVLATSREPLHLPGEVAWRVPSLRVPDPSEPIDSGHLMRYESVQLFVARAQEAAPAFRLDDDNARVVAHMCQRLDGLPLAIELAAAQAAYRAPKQIAALLDYALTALASRIRDTPDRQATLAATVSWSFELLDADERQLFPRLSVFAGGFTLEAAEQIASDGMARPLADVLAGLVDKSLVLAETLGAEEARYRLHEFVRQYAAQRLAQSGEALNLQRRHADWYCDRAESVDPDQGAPVVSEPSPWFAIERENLRVAMAHALKQMPERALRAAVAAWRSWMASGMHAEGLQWLRRALAACPEVSDVHVRALFATAVFEVRLGRMEEAAPLGRSIAEIGRHAEDPLRRAEAAHLHCLLSWLAAEWDTMDRLLDTAECDLRGVPPVRAAHDHLRALVALSRGDPEAALPRLDDALGWLAETPRDVPPFFSVCTLAFSVGRYDGITMPIFEETMLVGRRVGVAQAEAYVLCTRALAARASGRFGDAAEALDRSLQVFRSLGDRAGEAFALAQRGHLHRTLGETAAAIECFRRSADIRVAIPDQRGSALSLTGIALAEADRGNAEAARGLAGEAARILDRSGDNPGVWLTNLAAIESITGRHRQAAHMVERLLGLRVLPDLFRLIGWNHLMLAQLRERTGDGVGAEAALRAARAVFLRIGDRQGLAATDAVARR
jgi:predicted ATPase/DNA-binding SARP family transcriptional activator/tetratricopeptide (TPR) repeat protein